jgi:hypothetical protein
MTRKAAFLGTVIVGACLLVGCHAPVPQGPAQWLNYRSSANPREEVTLECREDLAREARAPTGIALQDFACDQPAFFGWKLGTDVAAMAKLKDGIV